MNTAEKIKREWNKWSDGEKYLLVSYDHRPYDWTEVIPKINTIAHESILLQWVASFPYHVGTVYVIGPDDLISSMAAIRSDIIFKKL